MNRYLCSGLILSMAFLVAVPVVLAGGGVLPTGQQEYEFIYDRTERAEALGRDYFDYQVGPYGLDQFGAALGPFSAFSKLSQHQLAIFAFAAEEFQTVRQSRATGIESFRAGFAGHPLNKLFLYTSFVLDEGLARDDSYRGKKWRGFAGKIEQAFVHFQSDRFGLQFGRFGSFWGPRRSLIFSPEQRLDGFAYTFRWGRLAISYRLARLDGIIPEAGSPDPFENRFMAAHRFDFHFSENLTVGLFETVVFGGAGRQIDLFYLNPLIFFHGSQLNEGVNDNTTVGLDFSWIPIRGYKFYGQLLIDDFQFDDAIAEDKEPDQYGILAGSYIADLVDNLDIRIEYSRVNNWTFNQEFARNRYLNDQRLIGSTPGIDYDNLGLSAIRWLKKDFNISLNLSYHRQGEGRVDAPWSQPWITAVGDYHESFPTGVVEKQTTAALGLKGFAAGLFFADLQLGLSWVDNQNHLSGNDLSLPFIKLNLSTFLLTSLNID